MRAVLAIFTADPALMGQVSPFVDVASESIHFDEILRLPLGAGFRVAVRFAYSVWVDRQCPRADLFEYAFSMDAHLQRAVLDTLAIRWGLSR